MKKFLQSIKKGEVAIYAIAIMLVAAGYLNYTNTNNEDSIQVYSEDVDNIIEQNEYASTNENIGDAVLVSSGEVETENQEEQSNDNEEENKVQEEQNNDNEEKNEVQEEQKDNEEETVQTSSDENDYFVSSKLERDTNYASMISNYNSIIENASVSETEKSVAMNEITNINNTKNAIMICENLLSTKGFDKSIVFVNDKSVNVVVKVESELTTDKVAQIQNIISRELNAEVSNIHITEKK